MPGTDDKSRVEDEGTHPLFGSLSARIRYRLGTITGRPRREDFLRLVPEGGVGAELGVFRGHFTRFLLEIAAPRRLHLIDSWWVAYGDFYPDWGAYTKHGNLPTRDAFDEARRIADQFGRDAVCEFHVGDDCEVLEGFPDAYFDWVYLDTTHEYEHTQRELEILRRKVAPGGLIAGDDWVDDPNDRHHGVARAAREFCRKWGWDVKARDDFRQWAI